VPSSLLTGTGKEHEFCPNARELYPHRVASSTTRCVSVRLLCGLATALRSANSPSLVAMARLVESGSCTTRRHCVSGTASLVRFAMWGFAWRVIGEGHSATVNGHRSSDSLGDSVTKAIIYWVHQQERAIAMKQCPIISAASAICLAAAIFSLVPDETAGSGLQVAKRDASLITGGKCGSYQNQPGGACTNSQSNSCSGIGVSCTGSCGYTCTPTLTFSSSGSFTGQLEPASCGTTPLPDCTQSFCFVGGILLPCCTCAAGTNVTCGPAPSDLDTDACGA
jgi:hypothetical protein